MEPIFGTFKIYQKEYVKWSQIIYLLSHIYNKIWRYVRVKHEKRGLFFQLQKKIIPGFLIAHPQVWNTFRDPQEAPVHWKKELSWETIKAIQNKCKTAMNLWGYRIIESKNDVITMIKKSLWHKLHT